METLLTALLSTGVILFVPVVVFIAAGIRVVKQYERGVVLTLGKFSGTRDPGLRFIVPIIQTMSKVDMRITTIDIPKQEVITQDNVPVGINAVVYFKVEVADVSILNVLNVTEAVLQYAQASLRDVIGGVELDVLLSEREKNAEAIQRIVKEGTAEWGVNVTDIKIQDIELPADMKRIMARQAESEREKRATIIRADGEQQAAEKLAKAAERLSKAPGGITMRTLGTIERINPDPSNTIIFTMPTDFFEIAKKVTGKK